MSIRYDLMTPEVSWRLVAAREISVKLHDKAFIWSTVSTLLVVVVSVALGGYMSGRGQDRTVAVVGDQAIQVVERAHAAGEESDSITARVVGSQSQAEELLAAGDVDAVLVTPETPAARWVILGDRGVDGELRDAVAASVHEVVVEQNAAAAGATTAEITRGIELREQLLQPNAVSAGLGFLVAFGFAFLFVMVTIIFGLAIAQSVVEEKQSRIVEILAATIPLRTLLAGKVVGNSLLAIAQIAAMVAVGVIGLSLVGQAEGLGAVARASTWFVVFFLVGFGALACLWAVAGSVATRSEDLQATTLPVQLLLFVAFFVGLFSDGDVRAVGSFVPLVSSVAMPVRMLSEDVPLWQPMVSAGLVVLAAVILVALGTRLYEGSLLRTDRRTPLPEAFRR